MIYYFHPYLPLKPCNFREKDFLAKISFSKKSSRFFYWRNKPLFLLHPLHHHLFKLLKMMQFLSVSESHSIRTVLNSSLCEWDEKSNLSFLSLLRLHSFIRLYFLLSFLIQNHTFFMRFPPQSYLESLREENICTSRMYAKWEKKCSQVYACTSMQKVSLEKGKPVITIIM